MASLVVSYAVAFVASVTMESPMMGLEKIVFGKAGSKPQHHSNEDKHASQGEQLTTMPPSTGSGYMNGHLNKHIKSPVAGVPGYVMCADTPGEIVKRHTPSSVKTYL